MTDEPSGPQPRIIEVGPTPYLYAAFPGTTAFYSTWLDDRSHDPENGVRILSLATLPGLVRRLADPSYDLVAVHAAAGSPWSFRSLSRSLFRRSVLRGSMPLARPFGAELLRGRVAAPIAVLDFEDTSVIDRASAFLLDRATIYFKRELPPDHWLAFAGTLHRSARTPRFRSEPRNRSRIEKVRPIALGIEAGVENHPAAAPLPAAEKRVDVFFAGRIHGSSTLREHGIAELDALRMEGLSIDIPGQPVDKAEYLERCARSWIVWSPPGYGWQCFRNWEAALCGAVPLMARPTIEQHRPLVDGKHALYYEPEPGGLAQAMRAAIADRARLAAMGLAARAFVLEHHTRAALARHIVETTLAAS